MLNRVVAGLALAVSSAVVVGCGGTSSPAQPGPAPTVAPAPAPTPVPRPLSVVPACALPASKPASTECGKPNSKLGAAVNAAIDRAVGERPDLFDMNDVNGGPRVLNIDAYMTAVVAALGEAGLCGRIDPEGEIGVKSENRFNEQWIIVSRAGWGTPTSNWVQRKYVGACSPSTF